MNDFLKKNQLGILESDNSITDQQSFVMESESRKRLLQNKQDIPSFIKQISKLPLLDLKSSEQKEQVRFKTSLFKLITYFQLKKRGFSIERSQYVEDTLTNFVNKNGNLLYYDDEIFPKVESICRIMEVIFLKKENPVPVLIIVEDNYKIDDWKVKLSSKIPEKRITCIRMNNEVVGSNPLAIIILSSCLHSQMECLRLMSFSFGVLECDINKSCINSVYYNEIRKMIRSLIIMSNYERQGSISDIFEAIKLLHSDKLAEWRLSDQNFQKRYCLQNASISASAATSCRELSFILQTYFLSDLSRDSLCQKGTAHSTVQIISFLPNVKQLKELNSLRGLICSTDLEMMMADNYYEKEGLETYFGYINKIKEKYWYDIISSLNKLRTRTLVLTESDTFLCRLYKKYANIDFIGTISFLQNQQTSMYGQILILQNDSLFIQKKSFIKQIIEGSKYPIRIIVLEVVNTFDSTLVKSFT